VARSVSRNCTFFGTPLMLGHVRVTGPAAFERTFIFHDLRALLSARLWANARVLPSSVSSKERLRASSVGSCGGSTMAAREALPAEVATPT
jgi:hypothetical protein